MMSNHASNVARGLMQASRAHTAAVVAKLAARGYEEFPFALASALWLLDPAGTRPRVLAQRAGVSKQAMSQQVRAMETRGFVEQVADTADTRAKVIRLTEKGERVKKACEQVREELNRQVEEALGREAAAELERSLDRVGAIFQETAQRSVPASPASSAVSPVSR